MLQPTFYDTMRFESEEAAKAANEIYKAEYGASEMKITDPDGTVKAIRLNYEPRFGLDVSDHAALAEYLNADMENRDNDAKAKL